MRVLVVEDDPQTAAFLGKGLREEGHAVDHAGNGKDGLFLASTESYDAIVLDRMLPGGDGVEAMARMRANGARAMILVLSALGRAAIRVEGLEKGADDYLPIPFEPEELRARLRALLRRGTMQVLDNDLLAFGELEIRMKARTVHVRLTHVPVSPKEFELLTYFAQHSDQIVTRMQLLENVWNLHFDPGTNVVDVHVGRLRRKLEEAGAFAIRSVRGEGYLFASLPGSLPGTGDAGGS